jgi:hypothetical protein
MLTETVKAVQGYNLQDDLLEASKSHPAILL